jgi:DNA-binding beta-propeller fold protein YncE
MHGKGMVCLRAAGLLCVSLAVGLLTPASADNRIFVPTGMRITPTAARGSTFQGLNPGLANYPNFVAGQAVATAVSPDGKTLLILTSGFNLNSDVNGNYDPAASNEYVFVYDISNNTPQQKQVLEVPNTFNGIAWNPNSNEFYVTGGVNDNVHVFDYAGGTWAESGSPIPLNHIIPTPFGLAGGLGILIQPAAAGVAVNAAGTQLLVANYENDSVSLVDLAARAVVGELDLRPGKSDPSQTGVPGGSYPFAVALKGNNKAYVSSIRDRQLVVLTVNGGLAVTSRIQFAGRPNKMVLNHAQSLLYLVLDNSDQVAVIDTNTDQLVNTISSAGPAAIFAPGPVISGSTSNSVALSPDEKTLFVTNGGTNSVAVIQLRNDRVHGSAVGLIPTGWYPNSVSVSKDGSTLYVVNGKSNAGPNPNDCSPGGDVPNCGAANEYVWQLTKAGFLTLPVPKPLQLLPLTLQVAINNRFSISEPNEGIMQFLRQKIKHVIYIVKENRTYDQVLGDLEKGNGDPSLAFLGGSLTPNFHQLARQFVDLDNFYDSGEVSGDGWNWSTQARTTDDIEKEIPVNYAGRGVNYETEGTNRNVNVALATLPQRLGANPSQYVLGSLFPQVCNGCLDPDLLPGTDDVDAGTSFLWESALKAGVSVRNYGFFLDLTRYNVPDFIPGFIAPVRDPFASNTQMAFPANPSLLGVTDPYFPGFDNRLPDYWRVQEWNREFSQNVANGNLPALTMLRIMHDHFGSFTDPYTLDGVNTVETQIADNDYAVGLVAQIVSHSPYKDNTLIFVIEDDSQDGPDHVDAHRSMAFVIGPYVKQGAVLSYRYNTVRMLRTIEDILGIPHLNLNDEWARPMAAVFTSKKLPWTYTALVPPVLCSTQLPVTCPTNAARGAITKPLHSAAYWGEKTKGMDFSKEDRLDSGRFNRILWHAFKGENTPYPAHRNGRNLRENRQTLLSQSEPR